MRRMHTRLRGFGTTTPAMAAAYSTRKIGPSYSGPALRVRRSSDNVEADIGFLVDGTLNETALLAHVGANSGFVSKLYDQSGNGRDLVQATTANQPRIVNAGTIDRLNTRAAVRTDGVAQAMASPSFVLTQPFSRSSVQQFLSVAAGSTFISGINGAPDNELWITAGNLVMYAGTSGVVKAAIAANETATVTEVFNGAGSVASYNGAANTVNPGTGGVNGVGIGQYWGGAGHQSSSMFGDLILFPIALDPTTRANLEANQKQFWGTP